jgi:pimeloyl-ACP methyl ester carboxylesterase
MRIREFDTAAPDGRVLHAYDTGSDRPAVMWLHGTPNIGRPPGPLLEVADRLGIRWVSYDRPGYGGSDPFPGRSVGSAADDVRAVADALGIDRFAVMGHSGGGSHAMACGALLPDRVVAVVSVAGLAPFDAEGLDWFTGMAPSGVASLRAAAQGRAAKERYMATAEYDPEMFTEADHLALAGDWAWFDEVVQPAIASGPGAQIDDDLAYVSPWGCDPGDITVPVLLAHGVQDRVSPYAHAAWLTRHCPTAELRCCETDGHISVLRTAPQALGWVSERLSR